MHNYLARWLSCFLILTFVSCESSVSPYKMELQDNEIACLINQELFSGALVVATLTEYEGNFQLELTAFKDNNSIQCSIISNDMDFVGTYYFDKKSFNGVAYSTNSFKYTIADDGSKKEYSSHHCDEPTGQVEITNFNVEDGTYSGFINVKICDEDGATELMVSECRFYNIGYQLVNK